MKKYSIDFFEHARDFINALPEKERAKVLAAIKDIEVDMGSVETKLLRPPIHELKIKVYRFPYFIHGSTIYIISGFTKKSQKTPLREIDYAMTVYSAFASKFQV